MLYGTRYHIAFKFSSQDRHRVLHKSLPNFVQAWSTATLCTATCVCAAAEHCEEIRILIFRFIYYLFFLFFFSFPISPHTSGALLRLNNNNNIKSTIVSEVVSHNGSGLESGGGEPGRAYRGSLTRPFLLFLPKTQEELVLTVFSPFVPRTGDLCNPPSIRVPATCQFSPRVKYRENGTL